MLTDQKDEHKTQEERDMEKYAVIEDAKQYMDEYREDMIAFAHCAIRNEYVDGADSNNAGYLEAVYVKEKFRNLGIASHLIERCEIWAKSKGCKQFESDCEVNNLSSINLHKKYGFNESAKLVQFIKNIGG